MTPFGLQSQMIGGNCVEVSVSGDVSVDAVARLGVIFDDALAKGHHVLLNFQACEYVDPQVVSTVTSQRARLEEAGLDVMHFGASGIVRPLLRTAFEREEKQPESRPSELAPFSSLVPRPTEA